MLKEVPMCSKPLLFQGNMSLEANTKDTEPPPRLLCVQGGLLKHPRVPTAARRQVPAARDHMGSPCC